MSAAHQPWRGVLYAIAAAGLFGVSTPFAKRLLPYVEPWLLAGLLYLGSGLGLTVYRLVSSLWTDAARKETSLTRTDVPWLAAAIGFGGVLGPLLLMVGLRMTPASSASLLLNLEGVFTALLAWFVFRENFDARIAWGMALISAGALVLSWAGRPVAGVPWGALAIAGAGLVVSGRGLTPTCRPRSFGKLHLQAEGHWICRRICQFALRERIRALGSPHPKPGDARFQNSPSQTEKPQRRLRL